MTCSDQLREALSDYERTFGGPGLSSPCVREADSYCRHCDEMVRLVRVGDGVSHCPLCHRSPGLLERGTESREAWHEMPEEAKP